MQYFGFVMVKTIHKKKYCSSFISKFIGLMFHKKTDKSYIFPFTKEMKQSLHTFFCFYPITVLFLNENKELVEIKRMKPFQFYFSKNKAKYVVESMEDTNFKVGEKINF